MLPAGVDEDAVGAALARNGLAVPGLSSFAHSGELPGRPGLLVGYGTPAQHRYTAAIDALTTTRAAASETR